MCIIYQTPAPCTRGQHGLQMARAVRLRRAILLLVVKEEGAVCKAADQVIASVLRYKPGFPHAGSIPKSACSINPTLSISSDPLLPTLCSQMFDCRVQRSPHGWWFCGNIAARFLSSNVGNLHNRVKHNIMLNEMVVHNVPTRS